MTWTERVIGAGLSIFITAGVLLAAAYSPLYLIDYLRQIPPHRAAGFMHAAVCVFFAWRAIGAYSTGSIKQRRLAPIERRDQPTKFWVYFAAYALLVAIFGDFAWRSFSN